MQFPMSTKTRAAITAVEAFLPDFILDNDMLSKMVDTTDEWIMSRIGVKERRILKEDGLGTSHMGAEAVKKLLDKTGTKPEEIDMLLCATVSPDMLFPATANIICDKTGILNAWGFDINAGCSGFLFSLETAASFIESGRSKKMILVTGERMSGMTDYTDRTTCPLFGDAAGAVMIEPTEEDLGILDAQLHSDGIGYQPLQMKAGGSKYPATHETVEKAEHTVKQDGRVVFKHAVSRMTEVSLNIMQRNNLTVDDVHWLVPHQANMRIIDAMVGRTGLPREKVMVNIEKYGNTSAGTIPVCLWEWEPLLRKGDNIILTAFGAGFSWGSVYLKWGYDEDSLKAGGR